MDCGALVARPRHLLTTRISGRTQRRLLFDTAVGWKSGARRLARPSAERIRRGSTGPDDHLLDFLRLEHARARNADPRIKTPPVGHVDQIPLETELALRAPMSIAP